MIKGLVSIITPAFNAARYIPETINSVRAQTYPSWEMLVIDDCSTDDTRGIVQAQAQLDDRIRLITLERRSGPAGARNEGFRNARGQYIAFLDSDDLWMPTKLEEQLAFMKEGDIAFSYTRFRLMTEEGREASEMIHSPMVYDFDGLLRSSAGLGCLTVIVDVEKTGPIEMVVSSDFPSMEDFILWLQLAKRGFRAYGMPRDLARHRVVPGSFSSNKLLQLKVRWAIYRKMEKLTFLHSLSLFASYSWKACRRQLTRLQWQQGIRG